MMKVREELLMALFEEFAANNKPAVLVEDIVYLNEDEKDCLYEMLCEWGL